MNCPLRLLPVVQVTILRDTPVLRHVCKLLEAVRWSPLGNWPAQGTTNHNSYVRVAYFLLFLMQFRECVSFKLIYSSNKTVLVPRRRRRMPR